VENTNYSEMKQAPTVPSIISLQSVVNQASKWIFKAHSTSFSEKHSIYTQMKARDIMSYKCPQV